MSPIEKLFDYERHQSTYDVMIFFIYLPFGIILFLIRFIYSIEVYIFSCILSKDSILRQYLLRPMSVVMGIVIRTEQKDHMESGSKVVVANYTTHFDHAVMQLVHPYHMVSTWNLSELTLWLFGYNDMGAKEGKEVLVRNAKKHITESHLPLLIFPEGETTNGRTGLLKFSTWPFSLDEKVQPVAINVRRPVLNIPLSLIHSNVVSDMFWLLFLPITIFHISYLPVQEPTDDEEPSEFAKRVQLLIARKLNIQATSYTHADKLELIRKITADNKLIDRSSHKRDPQSLDQMIKQVKNVLPHVTDDVIRSDLALTKDIDLTISNILEGKASSSQLQPQTSSASLSQHNERQQQQQQQHQQQTTNTPTHELIQRTHDANKTTQASSLSPSMMVHSSSTFGKSTSERHLSFQERKKMMIDHARQKYFEKLSHNKMD